ncbi:MAG: exo-alpha-sialidase [Nitrospiraceae bacterium]|nr:exo-alpha-sialidase [Nitrospiraceae bacterium]
MVAIAGLAKQAFAQEDGGAPAAIRKTKDIIIYEDERFYSAFPSVVARPDGELVLAFRRAPERRWLQDGNSSHTDPNSYLVTVRSSDNGETWSKDPKLLFAHPFGGSQDPCMVQLQDNSIICSSYGWCLMRSGGEKKVESSLAHGPFVFMGGYLLRSEDGGHTWGEPIIPPPVPGCVTTNMVNEPCPAYNRGAMCQGKNGRLYWAVASQSALEPRLTSVHLMTSDDGGLNWTYACLIAEDEKASFNETSLYETPSGDLVAFIRTANFDDHTVIARSKDGGKSFEPWEDSGFQGHPHYALRLPDDRVFLVYGYRHEPYGIRARVLNAECTDYATAGEIVLRDDGGSGDLGYPWATMTKDGRILAVYYFNQENGLRHIAGTFLEIGE